MTFSKFIKSLLLLILCLSLCSKVKCQTLVKIEFSTIKNDTLTKYYYSYLPEITTQNVSFKIPIGDRFHIYVTTDTLKTFARSLEFYSENGKYFTFDNRASVQISKNGKTLFKRIFTKKTFQKLLKDEKFLSITILLRLNFVKYLSKSHLFKFETNIGMPESDFIEKIEFYVNVKGKITHWRIIPNAYFE
jgi:hypothetical protein